MDCSVAVQSEGRERRAGWMPCDQAQNTALVCRAEHASVEPKCSRAGGVLLGGGTPRRTRSVSSRAPLGTSKTLICIGLGGMDTLAAVTGAKRQSWAGQANCKAVGRWPGSATTAMMSVAVSPSTSPSPHSMVAEHHRWLRNVQIIGDGVRPPAAASGCGGVCVCGGGGFENEGCRIQRKGRADAPGAWSGGAGGMRP
jgi:hypothetical protein